MVLFPLNIFFYSSQKEIGKMLMMMMHAIKFSCFRLHSLSTSYLLNYATFLFKIMSRLLKTINSEGLYVLTNFFRDLLQLYREFQSFSGPPTEITLPTTLIYR